MPDPVLPERARRRRRGRRRHRLLRRLPPRPRGLDRRRAARARPADLGHDVARGRADGHVRLDVGDLDRDAQVHPRPVRPARGRDRAVDRVQAGRLHRGGHRRGPARGVPAGGGVQPLLRRRRPRDLGRARSPSCSRWPAPTTSSPASTWPRTAGPTRSTSRCRWPRAPGSAACTIVQGVPVTGVLTRSRARSTGVRTALRRHRGRVRRQLRRDVGPPARRGGRRQHPAAGGRALLPDHRADRGPVGLVAGARGPGLATATSARRSAG